LSMGNWVPRQLLYSFEPPNPLSALTARYVLSVFFGAQIAEILELGDAQPRQPVPLHRVVPGEELIDRQAIALAHLLNGDHAAQHRRDDRGFAPRSPAFGVGWRQVSTNCVEMPHNLPFRRSLSITFLAMPITSSPVAAVVEQFRRNYAAQHQFARLTSLTAALTSPAFEPERFGRDRI